MLVSASCSSWVWILEAWLDSTLYILCWYSRKEVDANAWYFCVSLTPCVFQRHRHKAKWVQGHPSGKREKEQSFEISITSWYTPQQYSTENQWNSIKCVTAICAISVNTDFYQLKFCILDEEIFAVFTYIMTSCKSSILLFTCNRKLRSTLVISLRGIGGSKKSRLLLSSKRPT